MCNQLEAYKSQCEELGIPFDHTAIPVETAIGDEEPSGALYVWMKKVRNDGYINDPLYLEVAPRIEQICDTTLSPSMSFGELDEYMDEFCTQHTFPEEANDLEALLLRFPEIYQRTCGRVIPSNDSDLRALMDTNDAFKINDRLQSALSLMSSMPLDKATR